jgi:hypothetical protein
VIVGVLVGVGVGVSVMVALGVTVDVMEGAGVGVNDAVAVSVGVIGSGVEVAVSVGSRATVGKSPTVCGVGFPPQAASNIRNKGMNGRMFVMPIIIYCLL